MVVGTGRKVRTIRAFDIDNMNAFEFNKPINPSGGLAAKMDLLATGRGNRLVKIYQDLNDDGKFSKKELIYKGKCRQPFEEDELIDFNGDIKLKKSMHMCSWLMLKNPDQLAACTMEFIPTVHDLTLFDASGEEFKFDAVGQFADPHIVIACPPRS